jgi:UDP:flavonoid glycosyltransferase YjiC (YdhE family)
MATGLLAPVLAAVDGIDAEVVLALGDLDETELGTLPANVTAEHWLPLNQVLPGCDLVLHHAGSGTSLTAARFGVPQLVFPQLADQFRLASRLAETGAGTVVDVRAADPGPLREQLRHHLDDPGPRVAAGQLAREMAAAPALTELVPAFEDPKPS